MELLRLRVDSGPEPLDPGRLKPVCGPSRSRSSEISLVKGTRGSSQNQEDLLKSNQIHRETSSRSRLLSGGMMGNVVLP